MRYACCWLAGCSVCARGRCTQVSAKYQHQLVHVYILIEQVDPNPQVKADLTEIFTVRGHPFRSACWSVWHICCC
jgi:hypothetical protein